MDFDLNEFQLYKRCTVKSSKRIFAKEYVDEGIPFYRSKDIIDKSLGSFSKCELYISKERFNEIQQKHGSPQHGDILISSVGNRSGHPYVVQDDGDFYFKDGNIIWLSEFKDINPYFLSYWFKSTLGKNQLASIMIGSAQKALTIDAIRKLWVKLPPIQYQTQIAQILTSIDNKIEINDQIKQTLEEVAQAIFKSWFVDFEPVKAKAHIKKLGGNPSQCEAAAEAVISGAVSVNTITKASDLSAIDKTITHSLEKKLASQTEEQQKQLAETAKLFPNSFEQSNFGLIPKKWTYKNAMQVANINIGKTPPRKEKQWFSMCDKDIKWVSIRDMANMGVYALKTNEYLTSEAIEKFNIKIIPDNTVILSFKLTVGRVAVTVGDMLSNEAIAHFNIINNYSLSTEYIYLYLSSFNFSNLASTSSIATAVNSKTIKKLPVLLPCDDALLEFNRFIKPIFLKIKSTQLEIRELESLRDSLLPKLLSGELSPDKIQSKLPEAI